MWYKDTPKIEASPQYLTKKDDVSKVVGGGDSESQRHTWVLPAKAMLFHGDGFLVEGLSLVVVTLTIIQVGQILQALSNCERERTKRINKVFLQGKEDGTFDVIGT